ncbi:MAG: hypothetical protein U9R27_06955 [Campylobacterota bacterium]|nr:hypothetical protein [Campylobacterota bacterium]
MSHNPKITTIQTPEETTNYNYLCQNNISSITKGNESFNFTYDGNLLTQIEQRGILNQTFSYTYNNDFQITTATYANQTNNYSYNSDGVLISIGALGNAPYTLTRDTNSGFVKQLTDGTITQKRKHNNYGELNEVEDDLFEYRLKRDNLKISSKTETITKEIPKQNGKGTQRVKERTKYEYTYDSIDRLIEVIKDKEIVEQYSYDANGNRASAIVNNITTTASYTLDDQLVVYGDDTYRYDNDGYLIEKVTPDGTTFILS